jgi:tetratricopeptide (TPR) repeat protein
MATVEEDRKNLKAALEHLETIEKTFSDSPQLPAVILRQGDLLTQMKKNSAAREKYTYILKVPDWRGEAHARALYQTGQSFYAEDKFAEAHGYYERTFLAYSQFSDWSARAYLADAEALIAMGSKADALKTLEEALTTLPKTIDAPVLESIKLKFRELQLDTPPESQS